MSGSTDVTGATGEKGATGVTGAGLDETETVPGEENYLKHAPEEGTKVASRAKCPTGTKLTGGGARTIPTAKTESERELANGTIEISRPDSSGSNEWVAGTRRDLQQKRHDRRSSLRGLLEIG